MKLFAAFALFALLGASTADILEGECPVFAPVRDFISFDYMGRWYEVNRFEIHPDIHVNVDCVFFEYEGLVNGDIGVTKTHFDLQSEEPNTPLVFAGHMEPADPGVGNFSLFWGDSEWVHKYIVVATDYINYSIIFDCREDLPGFMDQYYWLLSRTPVLNENVQGDVDAAVSALGMDIDSPYIRYVVQDAAMCGWL